MALPVCHLLFIWMLGENNVRLSLCLDPLFWECILAEIHSAENSAFGKILKLFIRRDYVEKNCIWLVF